MDFDDDLEHGTVQPLPVTVLLLLSAAAGCVYLCVVARL